MDRDHFWLDDGIGSRGWMPVSHPIPAANQGSTTAARLAHNSSSFGADLEK